VKPDGREDLNLVQSRVQEREREGKRPRITFFTTRFESERDDVTVNRERVQTKKGGSRGEKRGIWHTLLGRRREK